MQGDAMDARHRLRDRTILIAEDDYLIAEDLAEGLRQVGARVLGPVPDSKDALRLIEQQRPACVLVNALLQGAPAMELARRLRQLKIPWVVVSTYNLEALPPEFREVPCVAKPYEIDTVVEAVATAMQGKSEG